MFTSKTIVQRRYVYFFFPSQDTFVCIIYYIITEHPHLECIGGAGERSILICDASHGGICHSAVVGFDLGNQPLQNRRASQDI